MSAPSPTVPVGPGPATDGTWLLALDASTPRCAIALGRVDRRAGTQTLVVDDDEDDAPGQPSQPNQASARLLPRIEQALSEAYRVLRFGGRFICLEFSEVDVPVLDKVYEEYSFNAIPALGRAFANDPEAYLYLVESIRKFPKQEQFAEMVRNAGFTRVTYRNLSGGISAIHSGWKI